MSKTRAALRAKDIDDDRYAASEAYLPQDLAEWRDEWVQNHGRSLRILHIGNIANNAFNNAKLLINAGFECDVLCPDYYHIMGCPEWEDADFSGDVGDHFRPAWHEMSFGDYQRPRWFVQGPMRECINYLLTRNKGNHALAEKVWNVLAESNGTAPPKLTPRQLSVLRMRSEWNRYIRAALSPESVSRGLNRVLYGIVSTVASAYDTVFGRYARRATVFRPFLRGCHRGAHYIAAVTFICMRAIFRIIRVTHWLVANALSTLLIKLGASGPWSGIQAYTNSVNGLVEQYKTRFSDRSDTLRPSDFLPYRVDITIWQSLFECYDIIIAYSTDPIRPMLAGYDYFALEHGTLREIPFASNATGRLTALAYQNAAHVFVTNFDCIENARRLCGENFSFINHPFDENHGKSISGVPHWRESLARELDAEFIIFFPTRHDWIEGKGYADKANDVLLNAFCTLRDKDVKLGMVCCSWGNNVEESEQLLMERGCSDNVKWFPPMGVVQFERTAMASDIIADQFKLGAFGGITFKAMAVGVPVLSYLDPDLLGGLYAEPPPVLNCRTEGEIVAEIERCIADPAHLVAAGAKSQEWVKQHHAGRDVVVAQVKQFRKLIEKNECNEEL